MARARRLRGMLLRVVLNRPLAMAVGVAVALPGLYLLVRDHPWETGVTDGLALVSLATGVALAWAGVSGRRPDWME